MQVQIISPLRFPVSLFGAYNPFPSYHTSVATRNSSRGDLVRIKYHFTISPEDFNRIYILLIDDEKFEVFYDYNDNFPLMLNSVWWKLVERDGKTSISTKCVQPQEDDDGSGFIRYTEVIRKPELDNPIHAMSTLCHIRIRLKINRIKFVHMNTM